MNALQQGKRIPDDLSLGILAGGMATRLGGIDKGLAVVCGRPLIEWVLAGFAQFAPDRILISANRNPERYARHGQVVADMDRSLGGPLIGVASLLHACPTARLLCVPVDCARPPPDLLERLLAADSDAACRVAVHADQPEPLFALYSSALAASALQASAEGLGVAAWQRRIGAVPVPIPGFSPRGMNLNTADDFRVFAEMQDELD